VGLTPLRLRFVSQALRLLPAGIPGKARVARLLLRSCLQAQDVRLRDKYGCPIVVPSLREPIGFHLLIDGVYEVVSLEFTLSQLCAGSVFVDVGANIGVFSLPVAQKVGSRGCVLAIEPSPSVFPYLKWNITLNGLSNVRLRQCAAFDRDSETLPFYEAPADHFGMGALAAQFHSKPAPVPVQTLDRILDEEQIRRVNLLKVDVEGFEAAVFRGAEQLLTGDDPPLIIFEFCDWAEARVPGGKVGDAQRMLRDYGYRIWRLTDFIRGGSQPLADLLTKGYAMLVALRA
jgi:FkbM family methyltransferase